MKFLMTYQGDPNAGPPSPEKLQALGKYTEENMKSGVVILTGGIIRAGKGTKVKQASEKFTFTDGPFAETKELIDGFAIVNAASKEDAIAIARSFMKIAGDGEGEILQIFDGAEDPH
jgi:hypothetical protein